MVHVYEIQYGDGHVYVGIHEGAALEPRGTWMDRSAFRDGYGGSGTDQQLFESKNPYITKKMRIVHSFLDRGTALISEGLLINEKKKELGTQKVLND